MSVILKNGQLYFTVYLIFEVQMEAMCFVSLANAGNFLGTVIAHLPYNGPYLTEMGYYGRY